MKLNLLLPWVVVFSLFTHVIPCNLRAKSSCDSPEEDSKEENLIENELIGMGQEEEPWVTNEVDSLTKKNESNLEKELNNSSAFLQHANQSILIGKELVEMRKSLDRVWDNQLRFVVHEMEVLNRQNKLIKDQEKEAKIRDRNLLYMGTIAIACMVIQLLLTCFLLVFTTQACSTCSSSTMNEKRLKSGHVTSLKKCIKALQWKITVSSVKLFTLANDLRCVRNKVDSLMNVKKDSSCNEPTLPHSPVIRRRKMANMSSSSNLPLKSVGPIKPNAVSTTTSVIVAKAPAADKMIAPTTTTPKKRTGAVPVHIRTWSSRSHKNYLDLAALPRSIRRPSANINTSITTRNNYPTASPLVGASTSFLRSLSNSVKRSGASVGNQMFVNVKDMITRYQNIK